MIRRPPRSTRTDTLFPYTTLFRSEYGRVLPDYGQLADYEPPTVTRVHAGDGRLLAEYATEKRVFVPMEAIPRRVVNAFLSAEDQNFYDHPGVDPISVLRAVVTNIANFGTDRKSTRLNSSH